ncbi:MAG: UDP-N-acetylmuramate--L-alanine ligase [Armatimonadetes bacterium]|nr:UDP-N-acetylmuramate--L-alanine ligase [Armatimonadota bacterium]
MELQPTDRIHFIGIGGVSMSALAHALADLGYRVSGSDRSDGPVLAQLRQAGVTAHVGHAAEHVTDSDVVVYTTAIACENPEILAARALGKRVFHRSELLAWLMRDKQAVAVTGTHGKTTCTAMLGVILEQAGLDPTVFVGGLVNNWGCNYRLGRGPHIVFEACESDGSFLRYQGANQLITGVEDDHLDQHKSSAALDQAFADFLASADPDGFVTWYGDCARLERLMGCTPARPIRYGEANGAAYAACDLHLEGTETGYRLVRGGQAAETVTLRVPGHHNVLNSLGAIATAEALGLEFGCIAGALADFRGTGRRFELLGRCNRLAIYDDYAHHPTEIRATLETARCFGAERVIAIFQPHLYSRTLNLLEDFAHAFGQADVVIIDDIYAAREDPMPGVTGELLAERVREVSGDKPVEYLPAREELVRRVAELAQPGDLILTIGAGDIRQAGEELARQLCAEA